MLTAVKKLWGDHVSTVFPWQGKFAHDPGVAANPMPNVRIEHISDVLSRDFARLLRTKPNSTAR
jgi:hypothetical protein